MQEGFANYGVKSHREGNQRGKSGQDYDIAPADGSYPNNPSVYADPRSLIDIVHHTAENVFHVKYKLLPVSASWEGWIEMAASNIEGQGVCFFSIRRLPQ